MHARGDLGAKRAEHRAVAREPALAREPRRREADAEMALAAPGILGMPRMAGGFVKHFKTFRREPRKARPDLIGN